MFLASLLALLAQVEIAIAQARQPANPSESTAAAAGDNPLADLPSKPGEHLKLIEALGDNEWINLGQASPDPKWGVARGRAWSPRMAFAPDLGGAFFCGTGVHGATPDGRYMDDLWFYDAYAHRWICLYPGADPQTLQLKLDQNGFEVNAQGDHIPVSFLSHSYCNTTYNTDLRLFHIEWIQCPWWGKALPRRWTWLNPDHPGVKEKNYGAVGPIIASPKHPLFWNVDQAKWQRKLVDGEGPNGLFQGVVEYIPALKQTLYTHKGTTWFYDYATNAWAAGAKIPQSIASYDSNGCFDTKRQRIYIARAASFAYYDIQAARWQEVHGTRQPTDLSATNGAQLFYDTANDVVLWRPRKGHVHVYDPDTNAWQALGDTPPEIPWKRINAAYMLAHGFYDTNLNVHFFYYAADSNHTDATMLAYRYQRAKQPRTP